MPFFHAEPLFEKKQAVLKQKLALLEAEKLHNVHLCVIFELLTYSFYDRLAAKNILPASISQFYFVKDSE